MALDDLIHGTGGATTNVLTLLSTIAAIDDVWVVRQLKMIAERLTRSRSIGGSGTISGGNMHR